jgi:rare lipoprotein A
MIYKPLRAGLLFLTAAVLLSACGGGYTTRVVDTPETRQLKGHQRPYTVNGRRYDPLADPKGFSERGMASWYGRDFHGKKTSNGEIYDMHAMTAAHKTLPMGTRVRVVNESNGREAVVRINDRGPFVRGRIIDLSYAAARTLGVVGPGTASVRIEALCFGEKAESGPLTYKAADSIAAGSFAVQIASFSVRDNALRVMEKLGGAATVHQERVGATPFYRVRAGRYSSLQAAEEALGRFERQGYPDCFVVALD